MKKIMVALFIVILSGCSFGNDNNKSSTIDPDIIAQKEQERMERELQEEKDREIIENPVIVSKSGASDYFIYTKNEGERWVEYNLHHVQDESNTQDNWRLRNIEVGDMVDKGPSVNRLGLVDSIQVSDPNNTHEYAYREVGADDYVGNSHGKEIVTSLDIELDGTVIDFDERDVHSGEELKIYKQSTLYSEMQREEEIAEVDLTYTFNDESLHLENDTEWLTDVDIEYSWVSLFPFIRGEEQSNRFKFKDSEDIYDASVDGSEVPRTDEYAGKLFNTSNDLSVEVEILDPEEALNNFEDNGWAKSFLSDSLGTNKFYIGRVAGDRHGEGRIVEEGTTWTIEQMWNISMSED